MQHQIMDYIEFVKSQENFHLGMSKKIDNPKSSQFHLNLVEEFRKLSKFIKESENSIKELETKLKKLEKNREPYIPSNNTQPMDLQHDELKELPEELLKELSAASTGKLEQTILDVINENGGTLNLDRILIGLFKKTNEIHKRNSITAKLYKMGQKNMVFSVKGKKGVYSTTNSALSHSSKKAANE